MKVLVDNNCADFNSYRAARVKSLFNAESGANFKLEAELPIEDKEWKIGVIVGPSGSGKTSIGRSVWEGQAFYEPDWPGDKPIVDAISPGGDFDAVTGALSAVGLGSVPSWLRPYHVLSMGEKFRADLARLVCERPERAIVDEFTSVVDRQIARFGALAFGKAWRRGPGQVLLLTPHYDVLEWLQPDWVFDTGTGQFTGRYLHPRPKFDLEIHQTTSHQWPFFKPHYYLDLPLPVAAHYFVGTVDGEPVCHMAMSTKSLGKNGRFEGRGTRLVVLPEWQGAGVGLKFLNGICDMYFRGENRWGKPMTTMFHTSHPGLCAALRRDKRWVQISAVLYGGNKKKISASLKKSKDNTGSKTARGSLRTGYGGHFRAVQGFRYMGEPK